MIMQVQPFWHFDIGNVFTWGIIALAWIVSRVVDARSAAADIKELKTWRLKHEAETDGQGKLIAEMEKTNVRLATLADFAEKRLERLENIANSTRCQFERE